MDVEVRTLVEAWHWMYFETDLLFEGLNPENLHRRPAPNLLAVSEHVAHVVRSEASIIARFLLGQPESEWSKRQLCKKLFGWPPTMLESPIDAELATMSVSDVFAAYVEQHEKNYQLVSTLELTAAHMFEDDWDRCKTVRDRLRIAAYHVGYHSGQIYTTRHLLGEDTPEN